MPTPKSSAAPKLAQVRQLNYQTPYFLVDPQALVGRYHEFVKRFPDAEICYAIKANYEPQILKILDQAGSSFEVASIYELRMVLEAGVKPERIVFGTAVKPTEHVAEALKAGVDRFAFDSLLELDHMKAAVGSRVYARALVDDTDSVFTMSEKFGAAMGTVAELLRAAKQRGFVPYGVSFNVGSQAQHAQLWRTALTEVAQVLRELDAEGIRVEMVNIGGGYPGTNYANSGTAPDLQEIAAEVAAGRALLPYPVKLLLEPGRGLVSDAVALVASVVSRITRGRHEWLYLDAGAYNALFEGMMFQGDTRYRVERLSGASKETQRFALAGPTGDGLDVISYDATLAANTQPGDKLIFTDVGAYSLTLASTFNGFPIPKTYLLSEG